jgi:hypothetical protein
MDTIFGCAVLHVPLGERDIDYPYLAVTTNSGPTHNVINGRVAKSMNCSYSVILL